MKKILLFSVLMTVFHLSFSPSSYAQNTNCKAKFEMKEASNASKTYHFVNQSLPQNAKASWSFGDGNSSSEYSPTHTYAKSGEYRVCLNIWSYDSVKNTVNCQSNYCDTLVIKDNQPPNPTPNCKARFAFETTASNKQVIHFNDQSSGNINTWTWTFGDGSSSTDKNPIHTYAKAGTYKVCLKVNSDSCENNYCTEIKVGEQGNTSQCNADFDFTIDSKNNVNFSAFWMDSLVKYTWDFGDNTSGTGMKVFHAYGKPGTYQVCLTVKKESKNPNGTPTYCEKTICRTLVIKENNPNPNPEPCEPCRANFVFKEDNKGYVQFTSSTGIKTPKYYWEFGDGTTSDLANPSHQYPNNSTKPFNACLTVSSEDSKGEFCSVKICKSILSKNTPSPDSSCSAKFIYKYDPTQESAKPIVRFIPEMQYGETYVWNFGDGTTSTVQMPEHMYEQKGVYKVCLMINTNNCQNKTCQEINLTDSAKSTSSINSTSNSAHFMIYPNPPKGERIQLKVLNGNTKVNSIRVYNALGKQILDTKVLDNTLNVHQLPIDTHVLPSGIYFMDIETDSGISQQKFIIE